MNQNTDEREVLIVHSKQESDYFVYSRHTAQDRSISYESLGILTYLLSRPENWKTNVKELAKYATKYRVYKALRELRKAGYVTLEKQKGQGKYSSWIYTVYDTCQLIDRQQIDTQLVDNQHTNKLQKDSQNTEKKRDTRKSANPSKSKSQKPLPVNRKTWQWEHIERYALENPDIDELAMLDDQAMHPMLKQLPTKATALDCIELYEEMKRNGKGGRDYGDLWMKTTFRTEYSTFKCMLWQLPNWLKHPQHAPVKQTAQEKRAAMLEQLRRDSEGVVFELPLMRKPE